MNSNPISNPKIADNILFFVAIAILAVILWVRKGNEEIRYDIIYLIALSLSISMVFAFLPFAIEVQYKWVRAVGTAGIFIACLGGSLYFAHSMLMADHQRTERERSEDSDRRYKKETNEQIVEKDKQLSELRTALEKANAERNGNAALNVVLKQSLDGAAASLSGMQKNLTEANQWAVAAQSNYSDSKTCSSHASRTIDKLIPALSLLSSATSSLENARAASGVR